MNTRLTTMQPRMATPKRRVPHAMPSMIAQRTNVVSRVSLRTLRKRTTVNTARVLQKNGCEVSQDGRRKMSRRSLFELNALVS